jgi:hypothetical protein
MPSDLEKGFYVLKVGALQEEPCAWSDIEAMCVAGTLSPEALIFLPAENDWRKVRDTELASLFDDRLPMMQDDTGNTVVASTYVRKGERDKAKDHFQEALEANRYHPRIVQEAKRNLRPSEWKTLRFREQTPPVWEDVGEFAAYPLGRGPVYLAILTIVLAALFWIPSLRLPAALVLFLGVVLAARATAGGERRPPLWHRFLSEPRATLLNPIMAAFVVGAELYGPFLLAAQIIVWINRGGEANLLLLIAKSPLMLVLLSTASLLYLPAVIVLLATRSVAIIRVFNPARVLLAVARMEREYVATVGIVVLLFCSWLGMATLLGRVPYAGHIVSVAIGVYGSLLAAFVLGRLCSRFADDFEYGTRSS